MNKKLIFICGLCVIEDEKTTLKVANYLKKLTSKYSVDFYFKASFDKANRTSLNSFRGLGEKRGLEILKKVKKEVGCKVLTDVHNPHQAILAGDIVDVVQIPAFLCRQTDLVLAVGRTGKIVNIKKGQFLSPDDMIHIVEKVESTGNNKIMLTERGTCFGYRNLVVDFRSFMIMKKLGNYPIIYDVTHSLQKPSADKGKSGGSREYTIPLAKAAIATGAISGIFAESHPNPEQALSDSATSLDFSQVKQLLKEIVPIWELINE